MNLCDILKSEYGKNLKDCTDQEIYTGLLTLVQKKAEEKIGAVARLQIDDGSEDTLHQQKKEKKKLYYVSAEFLIDQSGTLR